MTDTLFNAVLETTRLVGDLRFGIATSGSTSFFVDTALRIEDDDFFNGGIAFIVANASAAGVAPEGEFARISDYTSSSARVDLLSNSAKGQVSATAFSVAVEAGDLYAISSGRFSTEKIVSAVNVALSGIYFPAINTTALDTADNQTEYALPDGINNHTLRQVHLQLVTGDTNDNQWKEIRNWQIIQQAGITADTLVLPQLASGYDIRLDYVTTHTPIYSSTASISKYVHLDRVKYRAAEHLYANELGWDNNYKNAGNMANFYANKAKEADDMHPIYLPPRNGTIVTYDKSESSYTGEVGKVRL